MPKKVLAEPQPFVVKRSGIQGRGAFARRDIQKGERLAEYVGERISWKEADARYEDDYTRRHHTFLFSVNKRTVIDAATQGNDSRYINHSCDPNCEAIDEKGRIFIEAIRDIPKGEELFYDYSYARDKDTTEADEQLYVCLCGSANCRGTILEAPKRKRRLPAHHAAARHPHETPKRTRTKKAAGKRPASKQGAKSRGAEKRGEKRGTAAKKKAGTKRSGSTRRASR